MSPEREITWDDLESLSIGTNILGTGGGGDSYLEFLNCRKLYRQGHRFRLIDAEALDDDDLAAEVSFMGATLVANERFADPENCVEPAYAMERYLGRPFTAVMSGEIGGGNGMMPLLAAAAMHLPMVDADTMGRAFPEMQMSSFVIRGMDLFPFTLADVRDNEVIITEAAGPLWVERVGRVICTEVGSMAATCRPPRSGRDVKRNGVLCSVSRAMRIGEAVRRARAGHGDPIAAILDAEGGIPLFRGKVIDVARRTTAGFVRGRARIEGFGDHAGESFDVDFQNEFTIGWIDGAVAVMVPDLICILDALSGEAIGTETIRYGQRVAIVSLPAAPVLTSDAGLAYVGPRAFGYDMDYVALHRGPS